MRLRKYVGLAVGACALMLGAGLAAGDSITVGSINFSGVEGDFSGTGIGSVDTLITLKAQGQSHTEGGSVSWDGTQDVTQLDAGTGSNQSQTLLGSTLVAPGTTDLDLILQVNQDAGGENVIAVPLPFTLNVFSLDGTKVAYATFTPPTSPDPLLTLPGTGTGHAGWIFHVNGLGDYLTDAYRFGIDVKQLGVDPGPGDANDGMETFFLVSASQVVPVPMPPSMWGGIVLMGALLGWRRWRSTVRTA